MSTPPRLDGSYPKQHWDYGLKSIHSYLNISPIFDQPKEAVGQFCNYSRDMKYTNYYGTEVTKQMDSECKFRECLSSSTPHLPSNILR